MGEKIRNWLIKKLGGYTTLEYLEVLDGIRLSQAFARSLVNMGQHILTEVDDNELLTICKQVKGGTE